MTTEQLGLFPETQTKPKQRLPARIRQELWPKFSRGPEPIWPCHDCGCECFGAVSQVLSINPKKPDVPSNRGVFCLKCGQKRQGVRDRTGRSIVPNTPRAGELVVM